MSFVVTNTIRFIVHGMYINLIIPFTTNIIQVLSYFQMAMFTTQPEQVIIMCVDINSAIFWIITQLYYPFHNFKMTTLARYLNRCIITGMYIYSSASVTYFTSSFLYLETMDVTVIIVVSPILRQGVTSPF